MAKHDFTGSSVGDREVLSNLQVATLTETSPDVYERALGSVSTDLTKLVIQTFTSSGTYTPSSGMAYCIVELVGGGGSGGGVNNDGAGNVASGGGGGSGGYCRKIYSAADIGASQSVTIGVGGTGGNNVTDAGDNSTFMLMTAGGGGGGQIMTGVTAWYATEGGAGGTATGGDLNIPGNAGCHGAQAGDTISTSNRAVSGAGAGSYFGGGGQAVFRTSSSAATSDGNPGQAAGAGGSGGTSVHTTNDAAGGDGAAGICVITEFITPSFGLAPQLSVVGGELFGLTLSNNGTDASHDIDIAVGAAADDGTDSVIMRLTSALTKQADVTFAAGDAAGGSMDSGTMTANGTIHWWLISSADGSTVDVACSDNDTSGVSPTLPSGYSRKRRIGSLVLDGTGNFLPFAQEGDDFLLTTTPFLDVNTSTSSNTELTYSLSVPAGVEPYARIVITIYRSSGVQQARVYSTHLTDAATSYGTAPLYVIGTASSTVSNGLQMLVQADSSQNIHYRQSVASSTEVHIETVGWIDTRGKDA